jgi:pyruvate,orthophosphate dikinase
MAKAKTAKKSAPKAAKGKFVYFFGNGKAEGNGKMKDLLGGKGAGLAEMTNAGVLVPPGLTITTDVCRLYYKEGKKTPAAADKQMLEYLAKIEKSMGKKFGDKNNPLLVSVRSGAKFSMPGMMDTILNLGLNDETVKGLIASTNNERFAWGSPPLHPDVRQRGHGMEQGVLRTRPRPREGKKGRQVGHRAVSQRLKSGRTKFKSWSINYRPAKDFPQDGV